LFTRDSGEIDMPGGSLGNLGDISAFGSSTDAVSFFGIDIDKLLQEVTKFFEGAYQKLMKFPESSEFDNAFEIDGGMQLPSDGTHQASYLGNPEEKDSPQGELTPKEKVSPGEKVKSPDGSPTGPANGKYDAQIEKYAEKYGVDSGEIKRIMAKESQGDPNAVSPAGAVGLMQVKPETASELLGRPVSAEELKDPEFNIMVGTMYYAKLKKEKGSEEDALGSYNQGPNSNWRSIPESVEYVGSIKTAKNQNRLPTWG